MHGVTIRETRHALPSIAAEILGERTTTPELHSIQRPMRE